MTLHPYINFDGNCREAVLFYADVFNTPKPQFMTFGSIPADPEWELPEEAKDLIMHTRLEISGNVIMFSDVFSDIPYHAGNNISIALVLENEEELCKLFDRLKEGGTVLMAPAKTEWSGCYGSLIDKYGITWQFNEQEQ